MPGSTSYATIAAAWAGPACPKSRSPLPQIWPRFSPIVTSQATIVGSSAGGGLAIDFALEHPDKVQRLVLLGAVVDGLGFPDHFMQREIMRDAGHLLQLDQPVLLRDRIITFIAESPITSVSAERLQSLAGTYSPFVSNQPGDFYVKDGRLMAHFPPGRDIPLYPSSDSTLYTLARTRAQITFHRDSLGKTVAADIAIGGTAHHAMRRGAAR